MALGDRANMGMWLRRKAAACPLSIARDEIATGDISEMEGRWHTSISWVGLPICG
jgi:hypothetical protein